MRKALLYGAGGSGRKFLAGLRFAWQDHPSPFQIIGFIDKNIKLHGADIDGLKVFPPKALKDLDFDVIMITTAFQTNEILRTLAHAGVPPEKIDNYTALYCLRVRNDFLRFQSQLIYEKRISGSVAEGGVFEGYFARKMNYCFPDRTLYLFDTFEGFDMRSLAADHDVNRSYDINFFDDCCLDKNSFPHPEKVVIKKGFFPETAVGIDDKFAFVNLDFDLYQPIFDGLNYFYPKLEVGGVILVHDYFSENFRGVESAVNKFCRDQNIHCMAIGDNISVAIIKQ